MEGRRLPRLRLDSGPIRSYAVGDVLLFFFVSLYAGALVFIIAVGIIPVFGGTPIILSPHTPTLFPPSSPGPVSPTPLPLFLEKDA